MVHAKCEYEKNRKSSTFRRSKIMLFRAFGLILGGQKSSKMMTFSKHENVDLDMVYTANLSIWGSRNRYKSYAKK